MGTNGRKNVFRLAASPSKGDREQERFQRKLEETADELRATIERLSGVGGPALFDTAIGRMTVVDIQQPQSKAQTALIRSQQRLRETNDALAHLEAGTYGLCERCGKRIPEAHLERIPEMRLCPDCS